MPNDITSVSSDVFDFLKTRFDLTNITDKTGKPTAKPDDMAMFTFDYVTSKGQSLGIIVISLLDDNESSNSLKIYYGQDVSDSDQESSKDFYKFLNDLRQFSKSHMLGFDVRDINRTRLTRKDITPVSESIKFGPLGGTIKTSIQPLENLKIIIKHSERVDPEAHNARSRKIERLYLANDKGERFLLPFKSLKAARAMARHLLNGGNPYDNIGSVITNLLDEAVTLSKFLRIIHRMEFSTSNDHEIMELMAAIETRHKLIKNQLVSLSSQGGYDKHKDALGNESSDIDVDDTDEGVIRRFNIDDDVMEESLPYISRIYSGIKHKPQEQEEFTEWVNEENLDSYAGLEDLEPQCQCGDFFNEHGEDGACYKCDCQGFNDGSEEYNNISEESDNDNVNICIYCKNGEHDLCDGEAWPEDMGDSASNADYYETAGPFEPCECPDHAVTEESDVDDICECGHLMSEHNDKGCFYNCSECSRKDIGSNEFDGAIEEPFFSRPSASI